MLMKLSKNTYKKIYKRTTNKGEIIMKIYKTKLYRVDYKGTHGGGVDHIRGAILLEKYPWIVDEAIVGNIELTKIG